MTKKRTSASQANASLGADMAATMGETGVKNPGSPDGPKRPPRIPMNNSAKLVVDERYLDREKYAYRWFAEDDVQGGRVFQAKNAYWEHVCNENGENFRYRKGGTVSYLMRLEMQYYLEDLELKRQKVRATMMKDAEIGHNEYAPNGGNSAITRDKDWN